jgi:hypothetical protein
MSYLVTVWFYHLAKEPQGADPILFIYLLILVTKLGVCSAGQAGGNRKSELKSAFLGTKFRVCTVQQSEGPKVWGR